ncbi:hypothetical protein GE253_00925 [Niveispirillum sp. SYP-B3756]|uniref:hypothetical protein n=1 Tax=Niveispirillum sp. SYP-B3756 TaxID=2662178 RepID=UPI0012909522|nr:hypothetical protein [Niveispirillum sp. SYP-B3756]MQP63898.1 hypothetical protein [Niveispirillum sp. SYP-B3756]
MTNGAAQAAAVRSARLSVDQAFGPSIDTIIVPCGLSVPEPDHLATTSARSEMFSKCANRQPEYKLTGKELSAGIGTSLATRLHPGKQSYGNCVLQSAQQLIRWQKNFRNELVTTVGDIFGFTGLSQQDMEILSKCPTPTRYRRDNGTPTGDLQQILYNAGMVIHTHPQTAENISKAVSAGYPVQTFHNVRQLWAVEHDGGHAIVTLGVLRDPDTEEPTAYLVNDTGTGCVKYIPAGDYESSLNKKLNMNIVVGTKTCIDPITKKVVDPVKCCRNAYPKGIEQPAETASMYADLKSMEEEIKKMKKIQEEYLKTYRNNIFRNEDIDQNLRKSIYNNIVELNDNINSIALNMNKIKKEAEEMDNKYWRNKNLNCNRKKTCTDSSNKCPICGA